MDRLLHTAEQEAGLAIFHRNCLCWGVVSRQKNTVAVWEENYGRHVLHVLSTFTLGPGDKTCHYSELLWEGFCCSHESEAFVLDMIMPVSTTHVHSGLHSFPECSKNLRGCLKPQIVLNSVFAAFNLHAHSLYKI